MITRTPFYAAPSPADASGRRRSLLISYHFPPGGAVGALRWQKTVRFAAERGRAFDVITLDPAELDRTDRSRLLDLPEGTRVYGARMPRRFVENLELSLWSLYRRLRRRDGVNVGGSNPGNGGVAPIIGASSPAGLPGPGKSRRLRRAFVGLRKAYFAWMDYHTHAGWVEQVVAIGADLARNQSYDCIITSGPPHMAHEAGRRLAERTGLPLVIDLRDAWSLVQRLADVFDSPLWYRLARRHERRVVASSSLVVMNTARAMAAMQTAYPQASGKIIAAMNGFDDEPHRPSVEKRRFIVAYAGAVYLDRDPTLLIEALASVVASEKLSPAEIGLEFMGHVETYGGHSLEELARAAGVGEYVKVQGPQARSVALEFLSTAAVLVSLPLFQGRDQVASSLRPLQEQTDMAIPSKLFEYMQFDAWILAIAQVGSAAEMLLRGSGADVAEPGDVAAVAAAIAKRYREFRLGARPGRLSDSMPFASRRAQANLLLDAIDRITLPDTPARRFAPGGLTQSGQVPDAAPPYQYLSTYERTSHDQEQR